ncbi:MAG: hypothetical protein K1X35_08415 [Caulobacteraceae bacterium]|nr:hypothetical protein [Caulobacteraceae bacterium]
MALRRSFIAALTACLTGFALPASAGGAVAAAPPAAPPGSAAGRLVAAGAPGPVRVLRQVNHLVLQANRGVRLEEGVNVTAGEATLWLMPGSRFWQLQPSYGTVLTTDGVTTRRGPQGCRAARWGSPVGSPPLRAGMFLCVMTKSGDFGEVAVEAVTPTQAIISYTLWDGL